MDGDAQKQTARPSLIGRFPRPFHSQCIGAPPFRSTYCYRREQERQLCLLFRKQHMLKMPATESAPPTTLCNFMNLAKALCFRKVFAESADERLPIADSSKSNDGKTPLETGDDKTSESQSMAEEMSSIAAHRIYFEMLAWRQIEQETGMERIKMIFQKDHKGESSPEMGFFKLSLLQICTVSFFLKYIPAWREARKDFIRENRGTVFRTQIEAARRLQDHVTLVAGKEAAAFSAKMTFFSSGVLVSSQLISSYRNKSSFTDYALATGLTGCLARLSFGIKGMISGTVVGTTLGLFVGAFAVMLMKTYGITQEDRHLEAVIEKLKVEKSIIGEAAFQKKAKKLLELDSVNLV